MPTLGTNIENIHIHKKADVITVTTTTSLIDYSGQGFAHGKQASLSTKVSNNVYRKHNLFINVSNTIITIKNNSGSMLSFDFKLLTVEGVKAENPLSFAQALLA